VLCDIDMWHFRLAQIAILLTYSFGTIGVGADDSFGNELAQFQRYISTADKHSNINVSMLHESYRAREQNYRACEQIYANGSKRACVDEIRKQQGVTLLPLWTPMRNANFTNRYQRDCEYVISASTNASYSFQIKQSTCKSGFSMCLGGSTFEISASSSGFLTVCRVHDNFDNTYNVRCPMPNRGERNLTECLNVIALLEAEHFDAYTDIGDLNYVPLDELLNHDNVCILASSDESTPPSNQYWLHTNESSPAQNFLVAATVDPLPATKDYLWGSTAPKHYTKSSMNQCIAKSEIIFIGESHMRYEFDIIVRMYVSNLTVSRKHSDMKVSGMKYHEVIFANRIVEYIDQITCTSQQKVTTFVLQTGSWDLTYFPPRAFINSPYMIPAVVMAMNRLWARIKDQCEDHVRIVWQSTMPYPTCQVSDMACKYWRNNAAINAGNELLRKGLSNIGMKHFTYLDTGTVLLPRFPWREIVAYDHYLVAGFPDLITTTPGGMVLLNQVLFAACSPFVDIEAVSHDTSHSHRNATYYTDGTRYRSKSDSHYLIDEGWKRKVPDPETAKYMGVPFNTFITVENAVLDDIPSFYGSKYPSRRTCKVLKIRGKKEMFLMDGGKRRPLPLTGSFLGMDGLKSLGLDHRNVNYVSKQDLLAIPMGEIVNSQADCLHCASLSA
jgi:hypothetical protein